MKRGPEFRSGYTEDASGRAAIKRLLREQFALELDEFEARGFWDPGYLPFSYFEGDRVVSNVSLFPMPLMVAGRTVAAAGIQSVATVPEYRGRGLIRELMERVLEYADRRYEVILLFADEPEMYRRFGFRALGEHYFTAKAPEVEPRRPARRLSLDEQEDVELMRGLLARRTPVSRRFGLLRHSSMFFLNLLIGSFGDPLYLPHHDVLMVARVTGEVARIYDIVASEIPDRRGLLAALERAPERIEVFFPPDRLGWRFEALTYRKPGCFMVRGRLEVEGEPLMLPPTAAF